MQNAFRAAVLVLLAAAVVALFQMAQNGRYVLRENAATTKVVDSRTGTMYTVADSDKCKCIMEINLAAGQMRVLPLSVDVSRVKNAADVVPK